MYALIDIDNCIADDSHRLHLIDESISDPDERYEAYHRMLHLDEAHNHHLFKIHCDDKIIFVTARPERYRQETWHWLKLNFKFPDDTLLFMRPDGNHEPSEILKPWLIEFKCISLKEIFCAYDDRQEVLDAYKAMGIVNVQRICIYENIPRSGVPEILANAAKTFEKRNSIYKDNYNMVGRVMAAMFPDGIVLKTEEDFVRWHNFELKIVKISRFAASGLTHIDSIHDDIVYSALLEANLSEYSSPIKGITK
jgi:hypothetical protein